MNDEERADEDSSSSYEEDRELVQETLYPHPLPVAGDHVFKQATDPERTWFERTFPRNVTYLEAYKMAGDILFRAVERMLAESRETGAMDTAPWLVYPVYFMYRQAIELSLKQMRVARGADWGLPVERYLEHNLVKLWKEVEGWVRDTCGEGLRDTADAFGKLVQEIHDIDPKGDAGRYDINTKGQPTFEGFRPLDLKNLRDTCEKMLNFLTWIWSLREEKRQRAEERAQWEE